MTESQETKTLDSYFIMDKRAVTAQHVSAEVWEFLMYNDYLHPIPHRVLTVNDRVRHQYYRKAN